jgi:hypothetical protein
VGLEVRHPDSTGFLRINVMNDQNLRAYFDHCDKKMDATQASFLFQLACT